MARQAGIKLTEFTAAAHGDRLAAYVAALEAFDGATELRELKALAHEWTNTAAGCAVLDVGCGFGLETLRILRRVLPGGRVSGVDLSPDFIAEARRRASAESAAVDYHVGAADELPFGNGAFDVVRAERVLIYVRKIERALAEMRRVVRPGGRLALIEPDISTTTVNLPDRDLLRLVMGHEADPDVAHGYLPGKLAAALRGAGFSDAAIATRVVIFPLDLARDYLLQCGRSAAESGAIDAAAEGRWRDGILRLHADGTLFCTVGYFLFTATCHPG